jgi:hypothetical protein
MQICKNAKNVFPFIFGEESHSEAKRRKYERMQERERSLGPKTAEDKTQTGMTTAGSGCIKVRVNYPPGKLTLRVRTLRVTTNLPALHKEKVN